MIEPNEVSEQDDDMESLSEDKGELISEWKNPPTLINLREDLQEATSNHDSQVSKIDSWLDNLHVRGKALVKTGKNSSKIVPKLIRKQAEWRYPALSEPFLSTEDLFNVTPLTWEDSQAAKQNEIILNNQFNTKIDKIKFIDEYVRAAVNEGTVIVRVGWEYEEEEYEEEEPQVNYVVNPEAAQLHEQLEQLRNESPSQYDTDIPQELKNAHDITMQQGQPIEPQVVGTAMVTKTRIIKNNPTVEVCDYHNVIIDPLCNGDIDKAGFVIYRYESCLSDLRKAGKYKNLDKITLTGSSILSEPDYNAPTIDRNFNFKDEPRKKFVVYEYWGFWDIHGTGKVSPITVAWVGNTIVLMEENPFPDKKIPFVTAPYLPTVKSIYGEPDGALLEDNQKIIGAVTRGMIDIMGKSANGQTAIRKDMLDVTNRRKYDAGDDYEFNAQIDPRVGIHMHTYPEIPQSAQYMLNLQNMEAESLTGIKAFNQGIGSQSLGDVAAGIRGALDAASKRELGILRRLSAGIVKIGRKFIAMNAEFLSETEVVRVSNEQFVHVRKDDLPGSFDLKLSISTAEEDNNKAQELAFMLQTVGNSMDKSMFQMILSDIARLRKMPELAKKIEAYQPPPPDEMAQQKAQLELQLLQAQINQLNSEAQFRGAKSGTEQQKAANIKADTDIKNLDFVEQESGVQQERKLQLHGEQARSQEHLKRVSAEIDDNAKSRDAIHKYLTDGVL